MDMKLMSPRKTAPYHTLERSPILTSPKTVADGAMKTSLSKRGDLPRKAASLSAVFTLPALFARKMGGAWFSLKEGNYWQASHSSPFIIASILHAFCSASVYSFFAEGASATLPNGLPCPWLILTVAFSMFDAPKVRR